jgi:hypothetical protein
MSVGVRPVAHVTELRLAVDRRRPPGTHATPEIAGESEAIDQLEHFPINHGHIQQRRSSFGILLA